MITETKKFHDSLKKNGNLYPSFGRWFLAFVITSVVFNLSDSSFLQTILHGRFTSTSFWNLLMLALNQLSIQSVSRSDLPSFKKRFWYTLLLIGFYVLATAAAFFLIALFIMIVVGFFNPDIWLQSNGSVDVPMYQYLTTFLVIIQFLFVLIPLVWIPNQRKWSIHFTISLLILATLYWGMEQWFINAGSITVPILLTLVLLTIMVVFVQYRHALLNMVHQKL